MVPQTKVFVGSLPQGSKPEDLRKLFERFGVVTECDIMNRCGFVHMQTEEQASAAIRALHDTPFNGGVITVERGRIKERGQRGGGGSRGGMRGGGMRGGMDRRGGGGGGPMRGGPTGGRDAPYMRDRSMGMRGGDMRGPMGGGGGMGMRNGMGGGYDRGMEPRAMSAGYDDRYNGYGAEDRRGFVMDGRSRDPYAAAAPMYQDDRRGYGAAPVDDMGGMGYADDRRQAMYPEDAYDRRAPMRGGPMQMNSGYDRAAAPRAGGMGNNVDMYSRRTPPSMRGAGAAGGYERDPYAQQYPPMGRGGGTSRGNRELVSLGPRY